MLCGFLDEASYSHVAGWAADKSDLDRNVQVSVFVDGRKIVQLNCDQYRADLQANGLGHGRHGFRYDFPENLAQSSTSRIAVRFADTDDVLSRGYVTLSNGRVSQSPVLDEERESRLMRLPAPRNERELFELFSLYEPEGGVHQLLRRIVANNWSATGYRHAPPGLANRTQPGSTVDSPLSVHDFLGELVFSDEFQRSIILSLLSAYAEKRRLFLIHIPKCAGTDFCTHMKTRYSAIYSLLTVPERTDKAQLFAAISEFARHERYNDAIFMWGHVPLDYYLDNQLARTQDSIFSIIRDPIEIAVSRVNYVITRMRQDAYRRRIELDTREWIELLGIEALPAELSDEFVAHVPRKAFHCPLIVFPNLICHWLGGGNAKVVLERLARHHVEVTDTARYHRWLADNWGISKYTRLNQSFKAMSVTGLSRDEIEYLRETYCEDLQVYAALQRSLNA